MFVPYLFIGSLVASAASALTAEPSSSAQFDEADFRSRNTSSSSEMSIMSSTNTYSQAVNYGKTHPTRDGGSWSGWCASLMWRSGNLPDAAACPSAIDCYHKSKIVSLSSGAATPGTYHWWDIGTYGHVAMATSTGWAMMASCYVTESWGDCIGQTSVDGYTKTVGAKYLGWSYDYNGAEIADVHSYPNPVPPPSNGIPQSSTASTGVPDTYYYMRQQVYASHYGYTGPIDGVLGTNSWAGTQRGLRNYGYTGPDDGVPGTYTYMAMQRLASKWGYTGPIDGVLGPNSYKGLAKYFNTL